MRPACQNKVVPLESYKLKRSADKGFKRWKYFFELPPYPDENTQWSDLSDRLILFLCEDSTESRLAIYDLLMGAYDLGRGYELESLPPPQLLPLLDVHLFITDQVRFECMRRLGWIEDIPKEGQPIIAQVLGVAGPKHTGRPETPKPGRQHPAYREYLKAKCFDRGVLVRQHIPDAIRQFKGMLAEQNRRPHEKSSEP